jgi:hypothetical protein
LVERNSKRELEEWRGSVKCELKKGSLNFSAAKGNVLRDDELAGIRICMSPLAAQFGTGLQFCLGV